MSCRDIASARSGAWCPALCAIRRTRRTACLRVLAPSSPREPATSRAIGAVARCRESVHTSDVLTCRRDRCCRCAPGSSRSRPHRGATDMRPQTKAPITTPVAALPVIPSSHAGCAAYLDRRAVLRSSAAAVATALIAIGLTPDASSAAVVEHLVADHAMGVERTYTVPVARASSSMSAAAWCWREWATSFSPSRSRVRTAASFWNGCRASSVSSAQSTRLASLPMARVPAAAGPPRSIASHSGRRMAA